MMPRSPRALATAALLVLSVVACRRTVAVGGPDEVEEVLPPEPATLQVQNHHNSDITIYLVRGNVRSRLGQVVAAGSQRWTLPAPVVRDAAGVVFVADPIGERGELRTERVVLRSGARVVWTLESGLTRSSLAIY